MVGSICYFLKILFLERSEGRKRRNISVWLPLVHLLLGTWHETQACALTGNQPCDPLVRRLVLNPLSHTCYLKAEHTKYAGEDHKLVWVF